MKKSRLSGVYTGITKCPNNDKTNFERQQALLMIKKKEKHANNKASKIKSCSGCFKKQNKSPEMVIIF